MFRTEEETAAADSARYEEDLQNREDAATADGVTRAWKSFGSDIAHAVNESL